ncbi:hypothetical protein FRC07_002194 [Ceratobasidium sp. 392]|nr:hypothetical protein FRC07_002194 [Ceratobasidium sp. 392]
MSRRNSIDEEVSHEPDANLLIATMNDSQDQPSQSSLQFPACVSPTSESPSVGGEPVDVLKGADELEHVIANPDLESDLPPIIDSEETFTDAQIPTQPVTSTTSGFSGTPPRSATPVNLNTLTNIAVLSRAANSVARRSTFYSRASTPSTIEDDHEDAQLDYEPSLDPVLISFLSAESNQATSRPATPAAPRSTTPAGTTARMSMITSISILPRAVSESRVGPEPVPEISLGDDAVESFLESGDIQAADEAIDHYRRVFEAAKSNPEIKIPPVEQARVANNLSSVLSHRFEQRGDVDDMEEAVEMQIKLAEIAMAGTADPGLQAESLKGLGKTLISQFRHSGDPTDADLAVNNLTKALDIIPQDSPARPAILGDIAKAQLTRYMHMDSGADLDQALDNCEEAINALPPEAPERAPLASTYGQALLARFEESNNSEDINKAVEHLEYAVTNCAVTSPERPKRLRTYGDALVARFKEGRDEGDLQTAIDTQREALNLLNPESAAVPEVQGTLATAYHTRYRELGRRPEDLDEAIDYYKRAVEETPFSSPEHPRVIGLLGKAFVSKYRLERNFDLLNYAIMLHQQALALTPVGNRHRFDRLDNLGYAYSKRFRSYRNHNRLADTKDRTEALKAFDEALRIIDNDSSHPKFAFLQAEIRRLG